MNVCKEEEKVLERESQTSKRSNTRTRTACNNICHASFSLGHYIEEEKRKKRKMLEPN